jgi:hypothetical protein
MYQKTAKAAILERCLQSRERLSLGGDESVATRELIAWLIETIRPDGACFLDASFDEGSYARNTPSTGHC